MLQLLIEKVLGTLLDKAGDRFTDLAMKKVENFVSQKKTIIFVVNIKVSNVFFQRFCHHFISLCLQHDHFNVELVAINNDSTGQFEQKLAQFTNVYGALIIPNFIETQRVKALLRRLKSNNIPSVVIGKFASDLAGYFDEFGEAYYDVDEAAARMANAIKNIGVFGENSCCLYLSQNEEGNGACDDDGVSSKRKILYPVKNTSEKRRACIPGSISVVDGNCGVSHSALKAHRIADKWIREKISEGQERRPIIVACVNEEIAIGALMAIRSLERSGASLPKDFLFISFDYIDVDSTLLPKNLMSIFALQDPEKLADEVYARFRTLRVNKNLKGSPLKFQIETIGFPQLTLLETP